MLSISGVPQTLHITYPVPCLVMDEENWQLSSSSGLASVAPTILQLMGISIPDEMQSHSLLVRKLKGERPQERKKFHKLQGVA